MLRSTVLAAGMDASDVTPAGFSDIGSASSWAVDAINFARNAGIMSGMGDGSFSPKGPYTREQSIAAFNNISATPGGQNPIVTITMDDGSVIKIELYPDKAPATAANFVSLAEDGFYDGKNFHRIVPGFMIQGGCPDGNGTGGPGHTVFGEFANNGFTQNDISHVRGVVSMARTPMPNSAGSQFFICVGDPIFLDGDYAAFGRVIEGMDAVDGIAGGPAMGDRALEPRVMRTVTVNTAEVVQ
jgi:peptidyl-prolyl cis-trans isomerase B (cyclophilin B)